MNCLKGNRNWNQHFCDFSQTLSNTKSLGRNRTGERTQNLLTANLNDLESGANEKEGGRERRHRAPVQEPERRASGERHQGLKRNDIIGTYFLSVYIPAANLINISRS